MQSNLWMKFTKKNSWLKNVKRQDRNKKNRKKEALTMSKNYYF